MLANYGLALGVLVPAAGLQLACAAALRVPFASNDAFDGIPTPADSQGLYASWAWLAAQPAMLGLWLLLCLLHLRLAWVLLDGDWARAVRSGALCAAATATLLIFNAVMLVVDPRVLLQAAALPFELLAIVASARRNARLAQLPSLENRSI